MCATPASAQASSHARLRVGGALVVWIREPGGWGGRRHVRPSRLDGRGTARVRPGGSKALEFAFLVAFRAELPRFSARQAPGHHVGVGVVLQNGGRRRGGGGAGGGDRGRSYKYSGRDSLIFLVDTSKAMFEPQNEDGGTSFDLTIQCIQSVYSSKIIGSDRDLLAVVFYGTDKDKNSVNFKNVYVLHELDTPGAKRICELNQFKGEKGEKHFQELIGHGSDYSLSKALWVCANLFSGVRLKLSHKRIMLFTNDDNPHGEDSAKASQAKTKASDLRDTGIFLDLMNLKKPGGFDVSLFYRDIITSANDENLGVHFEESSRLEDLLRKVRAKETRKRCLARLKLKLGEGVALTVGIFNMVQKAFKPSPVRLYRETNEQVKAKTRTFNVETGSLLLPSDTKRAQIYGGRQIVMEKEETEELKRFDEPGFVLIGFKPLFMLKQHHFLRPSLFVYPEESLVNGSTTLFAALLTKCLEKRVLALCRYTPRQNSPPCFVALVPQEEELDAQRVQVTPPGFQLVFLPYADDKRKVPFTEKVTANPEQVDKMKAIVRKLRFKYWSDSFENPVLQQHFRNLEALALEKEECEHAPDLTLPKVEEMDVRLGSLVEEFKELVYPPDYNPERKALKRKPDSGGPGEKQLKLELSEEELKAHVQKGTLGKLTVPVLKEACRMYQLKANSTKKQELLDLLMERFQ